MPVEQKQADQVALTACDDPWRLAEGGPPCIRRQGTETSHSWGPADLTYPASASTRHPVRSP